MVRQRLGFVPRERQYIALNQSESQEKHKLGTRSASTDHCETLLWKSWIITKKNGQFINNLLLLEIWNVSWA